MMMQKLLASLLVSFAAGWRTSGVLPTASKFVYFAGKYCFDYLPGETNEAGKFDLVVYGETKQEAVYLFVFDDERGRWQEARRLWNSLTCDLMKSTASFALEITPDNGVFNRTVWVHEELRPRFWYFTFASCSPEGISVPLTYTLHTMNIQQGWQQEFGMDQRGSLPLEVASFAAFGSLFVCMRLMLRAATSGQGLRSRPLLAILQLSVLCSTLGAFLLMIHYASYVYNGTGVAFFSILGMMLVAPAKALLALLQLLLARGWGLLTGTGEENTRQRKYALYAICAIVVITLGCEIHGQLSNDWSTDLYLYESWPGLIILALNLGLFLQAWLSLKESYVTEPSEELQELYVRVMFCSVLYFLTLPVVTLLATFLSPWVREKYVDRVEVMTRFIGSLVLAVSIRPSRLDVLVVARMEEKTEEIVATPSHEPLTNMEEAGNESDVEAGHHSMTGSATSNVADKKVKKKAPSLEHAAVATEEAEEEVE